MFSLKTSNKNDSDLTRKIEEIEKNEIKELILSSISIENKSKRFITALEKNHSLEKIIFEKLQIKPEDLSLLLKILGKMLQLTTLRLIGMGIQDENSTHLLPLLKNGKLIVLSLADNEIGFIGAIQLITSATNNETLELFTLNNNLLDGRVISSVAKMLSSNKRLRTLSLSNNQIGRINQNTIDALLTYELASALRINNTLERFYFENNFAIHSIENSKENEKTGNTLFTHLNLNHSLKTISISQNGFGAYENKIYEITTRNISEKNSKRVEKDHTTIGGNLALLTEMSAQEMHELAAQQGGEFPGIINLHQGSGKKTYKFVLGEGAFGKLSFGRLLNTGEFVAVKKLVGEQNIKNSANEYRIQAKLTGLDNHILPLLFHSTTFNKRGIPTLYLALKLALFGNGVFFKDKLSLYSNREEAGNLLDDFAHNILQGIVKMHQNGVFHFDITPKNILFNHEGKAFISDFGCARDDLVDGKVTLSTSNLPYCAPEYLANAYEFKQGKALASLTRLDAAKLDAWSVGMTLLEIALNDDPFKDIKSAVIIGDPTITQESFNQILKMIPMINEPDSNSLWFVIAGLLKTDPTQRLSIIQAFQLPYFKNNKQVSSVEVRKNFFLKSQPQPQTSFSSNENKNPAETYFVPDNEQASLPPGYFVPLTEGSKILNVSSDGYLMANDEQARNTSVTSSTTHFFSHSNKNLPKSTISNSKDLSRLKNTMTTLPLLGFNINSATNEKDELIIKFTHDSNTDYSSLIRSFKKELLTVIGEDINKFEHRETELVLQISDLTLRNQLLSTLHAFEEPLTQASDASYFRLPNQ